MHLRHKRPIWTLLFKTLSEVGSRMMAMVGLAAFMTGGTPAMFRVGE